ncbi:HlyD family efflux transporter periplasmic adaptor subunit [Palleronia caenipelagi]|uniref:HlyD family efflux transporter periplasmic adaptor subunit n=1 Tax=Palleronia caenipelagi TaxID=2489174 RepID=A0A547PRA7_9RHOB|nr:HlyD family efflux transporter periplasmic adaptor subunit [Palleronia caenipelagi]TRD16677.1 HlyD family efflux transporter periplasmic adaptor subunit [Palleronia caenipelagi]
MSSAHLIIYDSALARDDTGRGPSLVIWLSLAAVAIFVGWAAFAMLDEIVRGEGEVISSSRTQSIQSLEGGILSEVLVHEGQEVEAGTVLARLNDTSVRAEVEDLQEQIAALELRRLRLGAEQAGAMEFDVPIEMASQYRGLVDTEQALLTARLTDFESRRAGAMAIVEQTKREKDTMEDLDRQNLVAEIEVTRARKAYMDAKRVHDDIVTTLQLERAQQVRDVISEIGTLRQALAARQDELTRTELRAPMRGIVNRVDITTIGGVVGSGQQIMELIPLNEQLLFEARVKPSDIAGLRIGQEATVKLSAYDYSIYGMLDGKIDVISADTVVDPDDRSAQPQPYYKVTVSIDLDNLTERQREIVLRPGMQGQVELYTGAKSVLRYLLKPLYRSSEALTER